MVFDFENFIVLGKSLREWRAILHILEANNIESPRKLAMVLDGSVAVTLKQNATLLVENEQLKKRIGKFERGVEHASNRIHNLEERLSEQFKQLGETDQLAKDRLKIIQKDVTEKERLTRDVAYYKNAANSYLKSLHEGNDKVHKEYQSIIAGHEKDKSNLRRIAGDRFDSLAECQSENERLKKENEHLRRTVDRKTNTLDRVRQLFKDETTRRPHMQKYVTMAEAYNAKVARITASEIQGFHNADRGGAS